MAEQSFPIVNQPLDAAQWRSVTLGIGDGILDQGGFPYRLDGFDNATNTAKLRVSTTTGTATAIVAGHYHKLDEDLTIELPAVTATRTYYVMLQYDPLNTQSPVRVVATTSIDDSQGRVNLHLWNVTRRANELLTDATVRNIRPRVSTTATYVSMSDLPQAHKVLWGSIAFIHGGRASDNATIVMSMNDSDGNWYWKTIYDPNADDFKYAWESKADSGSYVNPGHGHQRAIGRRRKTRALRGRVARGSGANFVSGTPYYIWSGDLATGDTPPATRRFVVSTGGTSRLGFGVVELSSAGTLTAYVDSSTSWISLDGVEWEVA